MYSLTRILISLLVSGVSGWLAGRIMSLDLSIPVSIAIGMVGGLIGSTVFRMIGFYSYGTIANVLTSVVGACILIWLINFVTGRRH